MARRFFSRGGTRQRLESGFGDLLEGTSGGREMVDRGQARAEEFDASQAVSQFGGGFLDQATEQLGEQFEDLEGQSAGAGRLRTGFFQRDQGRLFQDFNRRVANAIAMQSLNAARLDLQNLQGQTRTGLDLMRQQTDVLGGAFDRAQAEENAEGGSFLGEALGFGAGLVLPGVGSKIGAALGDKITGAFGDDEEEPVSGI